jgi:hypothetical protein
MPSDQDRLRQAFDHIQRIKSANYPAIVGRDDDYQIADRPWSDMPERSKLAILQDAVDWSGITNRDQAHIILSEIDPGKLPDPQRNRLIDAATRVGPLKTSELFEELDRQPAGQEGAATGFGHESAEQSRGGGMEM